MLDRTIAPSFVQSFSFDLIKPDKQILPNGIDLFFIRGGAQEVLKIELIFKGGRWFENVWGASYFAAHQLAKGTATKSSYEIAHLFDRYGAHLDVNAGLDFVSVSLYALTKNVKPVLDLFHEILNEPVFPQRELDQAKSIYQQNLKVNLEKTSFLASKLFRKSLFGEHHPYGKELEEKDIDAVQQSDLTTHFKMFFSQPGVFVSGKINSDNERLIVDAFSSWQDHQTPQRDIVPPSFKPFHQHQEKEGSVQSSIRVGSRSILRTHPDYNRALFVSHILGGYFGSRLMKNIREEKGLTYGIHASIHPLKHGSYFVVGADVNKENVNLTFDEIRKELQRLRTEEISHDEFETARNHFIGSLQSEITTPFAHADKLKTIYLVGLSQTYYQDMIQTLKAMKPAEVMGIGDKFFNENDLFELAVG